MVIDATAVVADDTVLGDDADVGPFCVVGRDGKGSATVLGAGAVLRSHVVVYRSTTIGRSFHAGHHVVIREDTTIGDDVSIGTHSVVEHHVEIADGVRMHTRCFVPEFSVLEEGAWLGPGVILTNAKYPNRPDTKAQLQGVRVGRGAVLGAGSVVLPGIVVGEGALVGAGALVAHDVAPNTVVAGNPAREL